MYYKKDLKTVIEIFFMRCKGKKHWMKEVRIHNGEVKYKNKSDLRIENTIYEKKIPSKVTGGLHGTEESLNLNTEHRKYWIWKTEKKRYFKEDQSLVNVGQNVQIHM